MTSLRLTLATALLGSLLSTAAFAQETTPAAEPAAPAPEAAAPAPAPAEPAPAEAAPATPAELDVQVFQDWETRCEKTSGNCFMYHLIRDKEQNPVSEITMVKLPDGAEAAAGATVITPLGTLLTQGVVLQIDDAEARQYPFNWCTRSGCFARFGLTDAEVSAMQKGKLARMRIVSVSAPDQPVILDIPLSGFTAAFKALSGS